MKPLPKPAPRLGCGGRFCGFCSKNRRKYSGICSGSKPGMPLSAEARALSVRTEILTTASPSFSTSARKSGRASSSACAGANVVTARMGEQRYRENRLSIYSGYGRSSLGTSRAPHDGDTVRRGARHGGRGNGGHRERRRMGTDWHGRSSRDSDVTGSPATWGRHIETRAPAKRLHYTTVMTRYGTVRDMTATLARRTPQEGTGCEFYS